MERVELWEVITLLICLFFSAFFSASETALMSLSKIRIRHLIEKGHTNARLLEKMLSEPAKLLGGILIGNNVVNILAASLSTSICAKLIPGELGLVISTVFMTVIVLIFGEITPKSFAKMNSEKLSLIVAHPIRIILVLFKPIVLVFNWISSLIIVLIGGKHRKNEPFITEEELKTMVGVSEEEGVLEVEEKEMIFNVFEFGNLQVRNAMIQRVDIVAIPETATYHELKSIIAETHFSRIPVYRDTIDSIIGILYVKDLIFMEETPESFSLSSYIREPNYIFEKKNLASVFEEMKKNRTHIAIIVDEHGGTAGLVTMEDLIERIVGNIEDEYDDEEKRQIVTDDNIHFIVDGRTRITDIEESIGISTDSSEFDSIGGYVAGLFGKVPSEKESISDNHAIFRILTMDKNRIVTLEIEKKQVLNHS